MKKSLTLAATLLFSAGAFAQTSSAPAAAAPSATSAPAAAAAHAKTGSRSHAKLSATDRVEQHIKSLHDQLKITAAQEAQWAPVAQTMRDNATQLDSVIAKREADTSISALDDLRSYAEVTQAQSDGVKKLSAVFTPLYDAMSDAQKKNADAVFSQGRNRHVVHQKSRTSKG
jgi:protein CpxP